MFSKFVYKGHPKPSLYRLTNQNQQPEEKHLSVITNQYIEFKPYPYIRSSFTGTMTGPRVQDVERILPQWRTERLTPLIQ